MQWTRHAIEHMLTRHGVSTTDTAEALADPSAIWADPDPTSVTGETARVVGWSHTRQQLITVILLHTEDGWAGVNGWPTKSGRDRTAYRSANDAEGHQNA